MGTKKAGAAKKGATKPLPAIPAAVRKRLRLPSFAKSLDDVQQEYILKNIQGKPIVFNSLVALAYNVNVAIVLNRTIYWYNHNKKNKINYRDERYWTYNSISEIREDIPYLSERAISLAIKKLITDKILIKSKKNYNKAKYDKTSWYSVNEDIVKSIFKISATDILNPS